MDSIVEDFRVKKLPGNVCRYVVDENAFVD